MAAGAEPNGRGVSYNRAKLAEIGAPGRRPSVDERHPWKRDMPQNKQGHHGKKNGAAKPKRGREFRIPSGAPRAAGSTGAMPPVGSTPS